MRHLSFGIGVGLVAGIAVATAAIHSMYPDVSKRIMRDGRRAVRNTKRTLGHFLG